MVYVAYARLRSLQAPKKYHNEWIISHAEITMFVLWVHDFSLLFYIWDLYFGSKFKKSLSLNFKYSKFLVIIKSIKPIKSINSNTFFEFIRIV